MDYLAEHREILERAVSGTLPDQIDQESPTPVWAVRDLVENGLLRAIDVSSDDGIGYLEPRITVSGREYLNELNRRRMETSPAGKARKIGLRIFDWVAGIGAGIIIAFVAGRIL